jgi:NADH-quinone oxidoreductase subunit N
MTAAAHVHGPHIDWAGLSPLVALLGGAVIVLLVGLLRSSSARRGGVPALTVLVLGAAAGLSIWRWHHTASLVSGALRVDDLSLLLGLVAISAAAACVALSLRATAPSVAGEGEYHALLLSTVAGMLVLLESQNFITLFLGFELLSIPLYVLCASELGRRGSLEAGLKYLIIGSVGSATLLYGLALIYGATGSTDFSGVAAALDKGSLVTDPLLLTGVALAAAGLCFKCSVVPFHQWTPDVYEGAPTPITAFQSVATKAAAFGIFLRLFDGALIDAQQSWGPILAALAAITIIVGNVGALGQSSLKRMLAYSSIAQAGYMLGGVLVSTQLGLEAVVFYLVVYLLMNMAAFAVVVARERETREGDDIAAMAGLGASRPVLAWAMTVAMLSLAGIPATAGFVGKVYLIEAIVDGGYAWLAIVLVIGSMISLAYYLRVVAAIWMRPAPGGVVGADAADPLGHGAARPLMAGGSPEADALAGGDGGPDVAGGTGGAGGLDVAGELDVAGGTGVAAARAPRAGLEVTLIAALFGAATLFFGIVPSPLFNLAVDAGKSIAGIL